MSMRTYLHWAPVLLMIACSGGGGSVYLTIDSLVPVPGSSHLRVIATNGGTPSQPIVVPLNGLTIPPTHTLRITFDPDRSGPTHLAIEARDPAEVVLTTGQLDFELRPGNESMEALTLGGSTALDMGGPA